MAAGVAPVDAAAAVVVVDLVLASEVRLGVVLDPALDDAAVDLVEVVLGDQERVVLRVDRLAVGDLGEVERRAVLDRNARNGPKRRGAGSPMISLKNVADSARRGRGRSCG